VRYDRAVMEAIRVSVASECSWVKESWECSTNALTVEIAERMEPESTERERTVDCFTHVPYWWWELAVVGKHERVRHRKALRSDYRNKLVVGPLIPATDDKGNLLPDFVEQYHVRRSVNRRIPDCDIPIKTAFLDGKYAYGEIVKGQAIEKQARKKGMKCFARKDCLPSEYVPFTDSIPHRITVYFPTVIARHRIPQESGGTWGEIKGWNQTWNEKANAIAKNARPAWVKAVWKRLQKGPEQITTCLWNGQPYPTGASNPYPCPYPTGASCDWPTAKAKAIACSG